MELFPPFINMLPTFYSDRAEIFTHKLLILNPFHYFCSPKIEANGTFEIGSSLMYQTNESKNQN